MENASNTTITHSSAKLLECRSKPRKATGSGFRALASYLVGSLPLIVFSAFVQADLQPMTEEDLSGVTGKSGITIDIETQYTIAEREFVDGGSFFTRNIEFGGIGGGFADNIRANIDIAGPGERISAGFSDYAYLASLGYLDATEDDVAWAIAEYGDGAGNFGRVFNDGDAVIHVTHTDPLIDLGDPNNSAVWDSNLDTVKNAIDFRIAEEAFGLRSSDGSLETALSENFSVEAYLGYLDIVLRNNGDGYTFTGNAAGGRPKNVFLRDSAIEIDIKFRVEDLDIDRTNIATNTFVPRDVTTPGLTLRNFRIHNERGGDTLGSFGFASFEGKLAAVQGVMPDMSDMAAGDYNRRDGQALYDVNVRWDWDLPEVYLGDPDTSIGEVYFTDFVISDTSLVITAH